MGSPNKPVSWTEVGRRARKEREGHKLGLREFAGRIGVSPGTISKFERGGSGDRRSTEPTADLVEKIANGLGVRIEWLQRGEDPKAVGEEPPPMSIGSFLLRIQSDKELQMAIAANPDRWQLATVSRALTEQFQSREDAGPMKSWTDRLDALESPDIGGARVGQKIAKKPRGLPPNA